MMLRKKRRKPNPLKPSTRSAVKKGPARNEAHLALIRRLPCVYCRLHGMPAHHCGPSEAHHVRELFPRTMGVRLSDYLTVSLCTEHHISLHKTNNISWWLGVAMPGFPLSIMAAHLDKNYPKGENADADIAKRVIAGALLKWRSVSPSKGQAQKDIP